MGTASIVLLSYFGGGLLALLVFDLLTKRLRTRLRSSALETQIKMSEANVFLGVKTGIATFLIVTILFWPAVFIGAITEKGDQDGTSEERA